MKLNANGYEIEIKVKALEANRARESEALTLLNFLSTVLNYGAKELDEQGYEFLASEAKMYSEAFYGACASKGYYG